MNLEDEMFVNMNGVRNRKTCQALFFIMKVIINQQAVQVFDA